MADRQRDTDRQKKNMADSRLHFSRFLSLLSCSLVVIAGTFYSCGQGPTQEKSEKAHTHKTAWAFPSRLLGEKNPPKAINPEGRWQKPSLDFYDFIVLGKVVWWCLTAADKHFQRGDLCLGRRVGGGPKCVASLFTFHSDSILALQVWKNDKRGESGHATVSSQVAPKLQ